MVKPLRDGIVIKHGKFFEEKISKGGIIIPQTIIDEHHPRTGEVVAAGIRCVTVRVGDIVLFPPMLDSGVHLREDDGRLTEDGNGCYFLLTTEEAVLAIIRD